MRWKTWLFFLHIKIPIKSINQSSESIQEKERKHTKQINYILFVDVLIHSFIVLVDPCLEPRSIETSKTNIDRRNQSINRESKSSQIFLNQYIILQKCQNQSFSFQHHHHHPLPYRHIITHPYRHWYTSTTTTTTTTTRAKIITLHYCNSHTIAMMVLFCNIVTHVVVWLYHICHDMYFP